MTRHHLPKLFLYETLIVIGLIMSAMTLLKLLGYVDFSSDWFWFIAAVGLTIEGMIALVKQKMFEKKYRIIMRKSFRG